VSVVSSSGSYEQWMVEPLEESDVIVEESRT
jgi:hypothetical protein